MDTMVYDVSNSEVTYWLIDNNLMFIDRYRRMIQYNDKTIIKYYHRFP
jgi:hypothetical protein